MSVDVGRFMDTARFLLDPYKEWAEGEGIPIHDDFGHDLLALETGPWARYGARGCFAHTLGRGDFMSNYVLEVEPTRQTHPVRHLYEAFFYVLTGYGSTTVWLPDGSGRTFEWGPKSLFAIPLNCRYQIMNGSGVEPARLSCTTDAPLLLNLFHNADFVFDSDAAFPDRSGGAERFAGEGRHSVYNRGLGQGAERVGNELRPRPDPLQALLVRGPRQGLAERQLRSRRRHHARARLTDARRPLQESAPARRGHARPCRRRRGLHAALVRGRLRVPALPWRHGFMYSPPFWMFHQHFNTGPTPARYLACSLGSRRYPFLALRRKSAEGCGAVSVSQGGRQIEYEDQDPRVHRMFLDAMGESGVASQMGDIFDEPAILALPEESLAGVIRTPAPSVRPCASDADMHDLDFDHEHRRGMTDAERAALARRSWSRTPSSCSRSGSTSAARRRTCCSRGCTLKRDAQALSSRFTVVDREIDLALADRAHPVPARRHDRRHGLGHFLHHSYASRAPPARCRQRRGDPHRRGHEARNARAIDEIVRRRVGQVRLRDGRAPAGGDPGGARLGRHRPVATAWRTGSARRHRRRHHQAGADRQRARSSASPPLRSAAPDRTGPGGRVDARRRLRAGLSPPICGSAPHRRDLADRRPRRAIAERLADLAARPDRRRRRSTTSAGRCR